MSTEWPKVIVYKCLECGAVSNREDSWDDFCLPVAPGTVPDHGPLQEVEVVPSEPVVAALESALRQLDTNWSSNGLGDVKRARVAACQNVLEAALSGLRGVSDA